MADQQVTPNAPVTNVQASANLVVNPSVSKYNRITPFQYKQQSQPTIKYLVVGAVVIVRCCSSASSSSSSSVAASASLSEPLPSTTTNDGQEAPVPRVLLVQRAPTDTASGIWEVPGGTCDETDPSLIVAVARELREETGLVARAALGLAGIDWAGRLNKVTFLMGVEEPQQTEGGHPSLSQSLPSWNGLVKLDPAEHSAFVWATEEEVRQNLVHGDQRLVWRHNSREKETVLEGFRMVAAAVLRKSQVPVEKGEEAS
ncbi:hypothetical protein PG996_001501 [Apiospora saccharicola]|uniref:Nudix hydrolase domain-containing protein n=1 Tax=Apiospora saccharicola TaxID=335842 RepID=A0ABR1WGT2_9PEZI